MLKVNKSYLMLKNEVNKVNDMQDLQIVTHCLKSKLRSDAWQDGEGKLQKTLDLHEVDYRWF